jgi:hypothetical protein
VNVRTQSPFDATVIVTPVALSTSAVHEPVVIEAALTEVEISPAVAEETRVKTQKREGANRRVIIGTLTV